VIASLYWRRPIITAEKPKRRIKHSGWVNIYPNRHVGLNVYISREQADIKATSQRITCIEIMWEEEEEK
jgi:hypothetical protein